MLFSWLTFFCMLYLYFQGNSVSTTKYSILTFLPKGLFEQVLIHYFCSSHLLLIKQPLEIQHLHSNFPFILKWKDTICVYQISYVQPNDFALLLFSVPQILICLKKEYGHILNSTKHIWSIFLCANWSLLKLFLFWSSLDLLIGLANSNGLMIHLPGCQMLQWINIWFYCLFILCTCCQIVLSWLMLMHTVLSVQSKLICVTFHICTFLVHSLVR